MTFAATVLTLYPEMFPGPLGVSLTYNQNYGNDNGLGVGWQLNAVPGQVSAPNDLIDHQVGTGSAKQDAAELEYPDGNSLWFNHVDGTSTFVPSVFVTVTSKPLPVKSVVTAPAVPPPTLLTAAA